MGAETFVQADGNQIAKILDELTKILQSMAAWQNESELKSQLARQCHDLLAKGNDTASFAHIQNEYLEEIEAQLLERKIPYMAVPVGMVDGVGSTLIVVPSEYEIELKNIEQDVAFLDTKYHGEVDVAALAESAQRMGYKSLSSYTFEDKDIAFIAHQKLLQAHMPNAMIKNDDGTFTIYTHPQNMFNPGTSMDGVKFEISLMMENAKVAACEEAAKLRIEQATYDQDVITNFINDASIGNNVVLSDSQNTSTKYLEAKNGEIFSWQKKGGEWVSKKLEIDLEADKDVVRLAISSATDKIHNMTTMKANQWDENCRDVKTDIVATYLKENNIKTRPEAKEGTTEKNFKIFFDKYFEPYMNKVTEEASKIVSEKHGKTRITDVLTMQEAAKEEKAAIREILKDEGHPLTKELLVKVGTVNKKFTQDMLADMIESIDGNKKGHEILDKGSILVERQEAFINSKLLSTHNNTYEKSAVYDREDEKSNETEKSAFYERQ